MQDTFARKTAQHAHHRIIEQVSETSPTTRTGKGTGAFRRSQATVPGAVSLTCYPHRQQPIHWQSTGSGTDN